MSALDLDVLLALCDAATPGPWVAESRGNIYAPHGDTDGGACEITDTTFRDGDAAFIAAAREAVPALITRLRAAEARTAWQPIETAPLETRVLVWSEDAGINIAPASADSQQQGDDGEDV